MSGLLGLSAHNRLMVAAVSGPAGVLCDVCGAEMRYSGAVAVGWDPPSSPVECPGCGYTGDKAPPSMARIYAMIDERIAAAAAAAADDPDG